MPPPTVRKNLARLLKSNINSKYLKCLVMGLNMWGKIVFGHSSLQFWNFWKAGCFLVVWADNFCGVLLAENPFQIACIFDLID
jgi:hypothetical protein